MPVRLISGCLLADGLGLTDRFGLADGFRWLAWCAAGTPVLGLALTEGHSGGLSYDRTSPSLTSLVGNPPLEKKRFSWVPNGIGLPASENFLHFQ